MEEIDQIVKNAKLHEGEDYFSKNWIDFTKETNTEAENEEYYHRGRKKKSE